MKIFSLSLLSLIFIITNAQTPQLLKDINPSAASSYGATSYFNIINNKLYFFGTEPATGTELWTSDGTTSNTAVFKDITPGSASLPTGSLPNSSHFLNGYYYFKANDGVSGDEYWRTDLTTAGTNLFNDLTTGSASSNVMGNFVYNNKFYFSEGYPSKFYETDGVAANTILFNPNLYNVGSYLQFNTNMYFTASTTTVAGTDALYVTDGTFAGTQLVKDFNPGAAGSQIGFMIPLNSTQFLITANDGLSGNEIWISDGTNVGTTLLKDINTGTLSAIPQDFVQFNGKYYFNARTAATGTELWVTDGTSTGTYQIADINNGVGSSTPTDFVVLNGSLYFTAHNGINGRELWKTDGTTLGTTMIIDVSPGTSSGVTNGLTIIGNKMYFTATDGTHGLELWQSDGSAMGTHIVYDLNPGISDGVDPVTAIKNIGSQIFFLGNDGTKGFELYYIYDFTLNLTENENRMSNFSIYPNPAKETVNIKLDATNTEPTTISMSNILGETVLTERSTSNNITINTNNLNRGVYFVTLINKGKSSTRKIIIE